MTGFRWLLTCALLWPIVLAGPQAALLQSPVLDHVAGAFDAVRGRVVIVGGAGDPLAESRDQVWSWSGTTWERDPLPGPAARGTASAAYHPNRHALIVAAGAQKVDEKSWRVGGDTWSGNSREWRRLGDAPARDHHALSHDATGGVLLFGGIGADRSARWPTGTWRLDDETWTQVGSSGPSARARTAMVYDTARRLVVLFGGVSEPEAGTQTQTFLSDTWTWDGRTWSRVATEGPRGRYAHGMVFDERAGVVLMYGGAAAHRNAPLQDMWQWDGRTWSEIPLSGATPGHRYQPVMVYDRARQRTVLVGGAPGSSDTWEWDGVRWSVASLTR